jgi:protein-tyrosine-phosphatase
MAATIMQKFLQDTDILVESRGMVVLFPEPYNPKAVAVASRHGMIMPSNSAAQLENTDFQNSTLVLVMNTAMKQKIYDTYNRAINVYTLSEFAGVGDMEVPDPYGRGMEEYNKCFEQLYVLIKKAADNIIDKMKK